MITYEAIPAPLPAPISVPQNGYITASQDFADPLFSTQWLQGHTFGALGLTAGA